VYSKSTNEKGEGTKSHHLAQVETSKESHHSLSKQAPTISQGILTNQEPDLVLLFAILA